MREKKIIQAEIDAITSEIHKERMSRYQAALDKYSDGKGWIDHIAAITEADAWYFDQLKKRIDPLKSEIAYA